METGTRTLRHLLGIGLVLGLVSAVPSLAETVVTYRVKSTDKSLDDSVKGASSLEATAKDKTATAQDVFAAARAEYGRIVNTLYGEGRYSPVVHVYVDGREATSIAPLDAPKSIRSIVVEVDPGPEFTFSRARVAPLAPKTELPDGFAVGETARSGLISDAGSAAVNGWRDVGNAKADVTGQDIVADHRRNTLAADLIVTTGPRLRFGPMVVEGEQRMRESRIRAIADYPEGKVYSPKALEDAADRLRRTGVFKSVSTAEDERITAPDLLGVTTTVVEEKPRRISFGAEIASSEGAKVSASWLHRNLFGGAEQLKLDAEVAQIGATDSGMDYSLGATLSRPATFTRDLTATLAFRIARNDERDYREDLASVSAGLSRYFSERLTARAAVGYDYSRVKDNNGLTSIFRTVSFPIGALYDDRDVKTDATRGFYVDGEVKPFYGLSGTDSGARLSVDARTYYGFGATDRIILAGRAQIGAVYGGAIDRVPRDYLFYSGGGGTVRGQPYQSLGITNPVTGTRTGGTGFLGLSAEVRTRITKSIGVVGFYDYGRIASDGFTGGTTDSQSGAGFGLRYATGFGPIRVDLAAPVSGSTGKGGQIYIGIGQSF